MIEIKNLSKSIENIRVLNDISAIFQKGKMNLIIGQSGSGKTVLLKTIIGLYRADNGQIFYDDKNFTNMNFTERKVIRQQIGMLFQGGALFDSINVEQNVMYPINMFTNLSKKEKLERVNFCLQRVNLENTNKKLPADLSGGMKKRVAIARAIAMNPKYLFCDEPNSGLDPKTAVVIDNLIKDITKEYNMTTIVNTHDMNSVFEIGEHILFIHEGKKWWEGESDDIFTANNPELNDFVFASKLNQIIKQNR
ncbi:ABC transporter ATP-binding protein [Bacteroidota bacterium]